MTPDLALPSAADLAVAVESADRFATASKAESTRRGYRSAWRRFEVWCASHGLPSLPAEPGAVAAYVAHLADSGQKVSTLDKTLSAIAFAHRLAEHPCPCVTARVRETMAGIRRRLGVAQRGKSPVLAGHLRAMLGHVPSTVLGIRDRALLTLGFAGGFRRSELVALDVSDLVFTDDGLEVLIRRSKTDQEGHGRKIGVPLGSLAACPVRAVKAWLDVAQATEAVFLSMRKEGAILSQRMTPQVVAMVVKRYAEAAGLDARELSGHSLRSGFVTSAAKAHKSERSIMNQTGHKSTGMVRRYIRDATLFDDNAAEGLL